MKSTPLLLLVLLLLSAPAWAQKKEDESLGFTWWNEVPELIKRGNEAYAGEDFDQAKDYYEGAKLRSPDEAAAAFNLGLAQARKGDYGAALDSLQRAQNLAPNDLDMQAKSAYNRGLVQMRSAFDEAKRLQDASKGASLDGVISNALSAADSFDQALDLKNGEYDDAREAKRRLQHFLQQMTVSPPESQQQQQQGNDQGEPQQGQQGQQQEGQQGQQGQQQPQEGQQQGQQQQSSEQQMQQALEQALQQLEQALQNEQQMQDLLDQIQQNQDQMTPEEKEQLRKQIEEFLENMTEEQKQRLQDAMEQLADKLQQRADSEEEPGELSDQEQQEGEQEESEEEQEGKEGQQPTEPENLTEEQARKLLNLLGDTENVRLRKAAPAEKPTPEKDW